MADDTPAPGPLFRAYASANARAQREAVAARGFEAAVFAVLLFAGALVFVAAAVLAFAFGACTPAVFFAAAAHGVVRAVDGGLRTRAPAPR